MVWLARTPVNARQAAVAEAKPVSLSVEERLVQIERSQIELNRQAQEIKSIARSIVQELGLQEGISEILIKLSPMISEIPSALGSLETQCGIIKDAQFRLQSNINRLEIMISNVSDQLMMMRR
jgi:hypothetical protein